MGLWPKRIALAIISIVIGFAITYFQVTSGWQIGGRQFGLGTTLDDYTYRYVFFTVGALAIGIGIWLDKFMGTEILPH